MAALTYLRLTASSTTLNVCEAPFHLISLSDPTVCKLGVAQVLSDTEGRIEVGFNLVHCQWHLVKHYVWRFEILSMEKSLSQMVTDNGGSCLPCIFYEPNDDYLQGRNSRSNLGWNSRSNLGCDLANKILQMKRRTVHSFECFWKKKHRQGQGL